MSRRYPLPRNQRLPDDPYSRAGQSCFFTVRTSHSIAPFNEPKFGAIAVQCLLDQRAKSRCQLEVYCVMPGHIHVIVTPMEDGASSLLYVDRFKGWCGRLVRKAGWVGPLWQPRSYDHVLRRDESLTLIGEYILHKPVRRGLCTSPEEYPWCGIPEPLPSLPAQ